MIKPLGYNINIIQIKCIFSERSNGTNRSELVQHQFVATEVTTTTNGVSIPYSFHHAASVLRLLHAWSAPLNALRVLWRLCLGHQQKIRENSPKSKLMLTRGWKRGQDRLLVSLKIGPSFSPLYCYKILGTILHPPYKAADVAISLVSRVPTFFLFDSVDSASTVLSGWFCASLRRFDKSLISLLLPICLVTFAHLPYLSQIVLSSLSFCPALPLIRNSRHWRNNWNSQISLPQLISSFSTLFLQYL